MTALWALLLFSAGVIIGFLSLISARVASLLHVARQIRSQLDEMSEIRSRK